MRRKIFVSSRGATISRFGRGYAAPGHCGLSAHTA
jgi:hypothetical protein